MQLLWHVHMADAICAIAIHASGKYISWLVSGVGRPTFWGGGGGETNTEGGRLSWGVRGHAPPRKF
jgi:hypothetical protein